MANKPRLASLEATLMRTDNPKYASYFGNGSGRDTYIVLNNGGLTSTDKPHMMKRPFLNTNVNRNLSPLKEAVSFTYHSDGSGRDSYVVQNSGGLVADYGASRKSEIVFKNSLRRQTYDVLPNTINQPYKSDITNYLNWVTPKVKASLLLKQKVVSDVTSRLSPTKQHSRRQSTIVQSTRLFAPFTPFNKKISVQQDRSAHSELRICDPLK